MQASTQWSVKTLSGPGWVSILTGVESTKHNIVDNTWRDVPNRYYKTFLWYARNEFSLKTLAAATWAAFTRYYIEDDATDTILESRYNDENAVVFLENQLRNIDQQLSFIYFSNTDKTGHKSGFSKGNPHYIEAIEIIDWQISRMLRAIEKRTTRQDEEWLITVTTDHGGKSTHHGYAIPKPVTRKIPLIFSGDGLGSGHIDADCILKVSHIDIFPSIMEYLRLPVRDEWDLDGKSRLKWPLTAKEKCNLSKSKPVISLSGAYILNEATHLSEMTLD